MYYDALDAGSLDKQITLQSRSEADDDGGGQTITWADVVTVWASIAPGSGREFVDAQQLQPELSHIVKMRYRSGVTAKYRLKFGSRVFPIHAVLNPNERNEQLVLYCSELSPT